MNAELLVRVLEVLAHGARRDPEDLGDLRVRHPATRARISRSRGVKHPAVNPARRSDDAPHCAAAGAGAAEQIENEAVPFGEAPVSPVELETRIRRIEPEADHVVDSERKGDLLVEAQTVIFAPREVVVVRASAVDRPQRILPRMPHRRLADGRRDFRGRLAGAAARPGRPEPLDPSKGRRLQFTLLGEKPCGGRADILADATYERVG
jgi:hypothetical protein